MSQQIILPDRVVYDLVGVQRNFEALRKFIEGFTSTTFIIGSDGTSGPTERCAFILTAIDRVTGPTSQPPTVDDAYSLGFDTQATAQYGTALGLSTLVSGFASNVNGESCTVHGANGSNANGISNTIEAACDYGTNANGNSNNIRSGADFGANVNGISNEVTGNYGANANGVSNVVNGSDGANVNGNSNIVNGGYGASANGYSCTADRDASQAEGDSAIADHYASHAHASGGPGQYERIIVWGTTANATPLALTSAGSAVDIPTDEMWMVEVHVSAKQTAGTGSGLAAFRIAGAIGYPGGVLAIVDVPAVRQWGFGNGLTWGVDLVAGTGLEVTVFGQASKTIKWVATIHATRIF